MSTEGLTNFIDYIKYWGQMIIEMFARIKAWMDANFPSDGEGEDEK